jgi:hypothetical protein
MCWSNVDQVFGRFQGDQIVQNLGIWATLGINQHKIGPKLATFWLFYLTFFLTFLALQLYGLLKVLKVV